MPQNDRQTMLKVRSERHGIECARGARGRGYTRCGEGKAKEQKELLLQLNFG